MRITQKGQVTIPEAIRQKYSFFPYTDIIFVEEKGKVYIQIATKNKKNRGRTLVEHLRGTASVRMTTDEILALTRGEK